MKLSVNLNKVALLRNSREGAYPKLAQVAQVCIAAGAHGLTLHWRQDNRHARADDVRELCALAKKHGVEFNLEGDTRPELVALALEVCPTQYTLVPVTPGEVTSNHGWKLPQDTKALLPIIRQAKAANIRTSVFLDPDPTLVERVTETEADRIEIYTEPYAKHFGTGKEREALGLVKACSKKAQSLGIGVNAGHDLNLANLPLLAREVPDLAEVSIGHAIINDALYFGFSETIRAYLMATRGVECTLPMTSFVQPAGFSKV